MEDAHRVEDTPSTSPSSTDATPPAATGAFPIVGLGASAGGLEAFKQFFTHTPPDSGMAFVLVQHLDPTQESLLVDLIQRTTRMPVSQAREGIAVAPNHVYVIPPNRDMTLHEGHLHLREPGQRRGLRLPIDTFFRSLAEDRRDRAIGVVLSGTGSDGTLGLKAIKGEGGLTVTQDPATAKYDGMPNRAVDTGLIDYIRPPAEMPAAIIAYAQHAFPPEAPSVAPILTRAQDPRHDLFTLLRQQTGHDFSGYKASTIGRRIQRRMAINQIEKIEAYVRLLNDSPGEVHTLFRELLIGVTGFFRDPEAFKVLGNDVILRSLADLRPDQPFRAWVPGCATGEEAYTLAILIANTMAREGRNHPVQIFATDIDDQAIEKARMGRYPENIAADVRPAYLQRYFLRDGQGFQVSRRIRDSVVFAVHSLIKDPPFSNVALISCRNLLIYLKSDLQEQALATFHYALKPEGYLFLGSSESLGALSQAFTPLSKKWNIFQRADDIQPPHPGFPTMPASNGEDVMMVGRGSLGYSLRDATQQLLLDQYAPPCAIVNPYGDIKYVYGRLGKYLEPTTGEPRMNVRHFARMGLRVPLTSALRKAVEQQEPVVREGVRVQTDDGTQTITLTVQPIVHPAVMRGLLQVIFEDAPDPSAIPVKTADEDAAGSEDTDEASQRRIAELEQALTSTRQYLQTTTEELQTSNEELQSINEELQSSNEELQTSQEELQSSNEELLTVNNELKSKIEQLTQANEDINNLLNSISFGLIFLDRELRVQRFNPQAQEIVHLIETDIGRPLGHLVPNVAYDTLIEDCEGVLETLEIHEIEVQTREADRWYTLRIQPYYSLGGDVTGLVLTFADITAQKAMHAELEDHRDHLEQLVAERTEALAEKSLMLEHILASTTDHTYVFDPDARFVYVSESGTGALGTTREAIVGRQWMEIGLPEATAAPYHAQVQKVFETGQSLQGETEFPTADGPRQFEYILNPLHGPSGDVRYVLSTSRDITTRKRAEQEMERYAAELERSNEELERFGYIVSHDLQTPLRAVKGFLELLAGRYRGQLDDSADQFINYAMDGAERMQAMIHALLDLSRVDTQGRDFTPTDVEAVLARTLQALEQTIETAGAEVTYEAMPTVRADEIQLTHVFQNLIANAIKFRREGVPPRVHVAAREAEEEWIFTVTDNGIGLDTEHSDRIFQVFQRLHTQEEYEGTGLGLALCKRIVERHGGRIWVESQPGEGATFTFTIPADEERNPL